MKLLMIGDIVGKSGRKALRALLPRIIQQEGIDFVIANGENSAAGFGITESVAREIFSAGVDVITGGNHIWDKKEAVDYLNREHRILRPLNYPPGAPGLGSKTYELPDGSRICIINASGRVFMQPIDCPFRTIDAELNRVKADVILVDFHAEATSEKIAIGYHLDGRVSAVVGTHTHVQTADERILDGGTAYITDVGMTGPLNSVIGVEKDIIIERFISALPHRFNTATGRSSLAAVVVDIDSNSLRALSIKRLQVEHS